MICCIPICSTSATIPFRVRKRLCSGTTGVLLIFNVGFRITTTPVTYVPLIVGMGMENGNADSTRRWRYLTQVWCIVALSGSRISNEDGYVARIRHSINHPSRFNPISSLAAGRESRVDGRVGVR